MSGGRSSGHRVTVVIATRNRRDILLRSLERLTACPEAPPIIVVDNGSSDGTTLAVRRRYADAAPGVKVIELPANRGAVARNVGVVAASTPFVAFADDDSWWTPGSLSRADQILAGQSDVAAVIARVELEPSGDIDNVSRKWRRSPLGYVAGRPYPRTLSFPAFAAVVRVNAFRQVGGFSELLFFGGEEQLLAIDLAAAGWQLCYVDDVIVRHAPANERVSPGRWAVQTRNDVLVLWLRLSWRSAVGATIRLGRRSLHDHDAGNAALGVLRRLPAALRRRRRVPAALEAELRIAMAPE